MRQTSCCLFLRITKSEDFNSTSRYLDDLLNIDSSFFDSMVNQVNHIYPSELQLNKPTFQIPRPHFWIYIRHISVLKFIINEMILILIL